MKRMPFAWAVLVAGISMTSGTSLGQEVAPKPGPEHALLKRMAGTWDAMVRMPGYPDCTGTMTWKLDLNDRWLFGEFEGKFGDIDFRGRDITGYDTNKKKYVTVWVDSMSSGLTTSSGTYDPKTRTMTCFGTTPDPATGKLIKTKDVSRVINDKKMIFEMYHQADGGQFEKMMTIEYTRK